MAEQYIVSARKYRPQTWETVVGQQAITATLNTAIQAGKIAQAYLFCGPRGVGKTTCARIFAREVNKEAVAKDADLSFNVFELDGASNSTVDDMRSLTDQVRIPPQIGDYKVYIIDEVHMLSASAFNAFLKTLEEPPAHAIFILATTEKHKIIPTILSRCQIFDFKRIKVKDIADQLAKIAESEGITADPEALHLIAMKADGAMRDALSMFDQIVSFSGKEITYDSVIQNLNVLDYENYFKVLDFMQAEDVSGALNLLNEVLDKGFDGHHFVTGLGEHLRNLLVSKDPQTIPLLEVSETVAEKYQKQAQDIDLRDLITAMDFVNTCDLNYKNSKNQRLTIELCLIQLCSIAYNKAEKKKSDFELIPITVSSQFGTPKQKVTTSAPPETAAPPSPVEIVSPTEPVADTPPPVEPEPEPKTPSKPKRSLASTKKFGSAGVSLSGLFEETGVEVSDEEGAEAIEEVNDQFTDEEFKEAWKAFAEIQLKADKRSIYSTLTMEMPTCDEGRITLQITNSVQEMEVDSIRGDLMEFLRNRLNNSGLSLEMILVKDDSNKMMLYTDKDKYDAMNNLNPELDYFRKRLNLDLDF